MKIFSPNITGSLIVTGSINTITGSLTVTQGITGSLFGTASFAISASHAQNAATASFVLNSVSASFATNALSASFATSASLAQTANTASYVLNAVSASFAPIFPFTGSAQITGSLGVTGSINSSQDIIVNGVDIGEGGGSVVTNTRIGTSALRCNTTGNNNSNANGDNNHLLSTKTNGWLYRK